MKVLAIDPIHPDGLALLAAHPDVELVHLEAPDEADLARHMADAEALLLRGRQLAPGHWERAGRLRLVSRHGVGCDNLDLEALAARGVAVAISADANLVSVAEHAMTLTLAALKRLPAAEAAARGDRWAERDRLGARDLADQRVLVVGYGRIGRAYAARVAAFGARIAVHDPHAPADAPLPEGARRVDDLAAAVAEADVASIHVPLAAESAGLFGADLLARFPEGAVLVNTARGGIVDEAALPGALAAGRPALYATDVLASEPPDPAHPLLSRDDVIVTPHSAALTEGGMRRMATGAARNILDFLDGRLDPAMTVLAPPPAAGPGDAADGGPRQG